MAKGKLPAAERVAILTNRIENLYRGGSGSYAGPEHRQKAIDTAEDALADAKAELAKETAH